MSVSCSSVSSASDRRRMRNVACREDKGDGKRSHPFAAFFFPNGAQANQLLIHRRIRLGVTMGHQFSIELGSSMATSFPPFARDRAGVNQDRSFAGEIVVGETRHGPTSARPWHGLSQPGKPRPFARSPVCVRLRLAGIEQGAPLASPGSARLPLDSISVAVQVAQEREGWLLTPQSGGSDEQQDDAPASPS
jgi:hypothetical protein